jgi:hypothetical protein
VKLLGWIKSAVERVKMPAAPRQRGPSPPDDVGSRTPPQDSRPGEVGDRPERPLDVAPGLQAGIEDPGRISVGSEGPINPEPEGSPSQQEIDRRRLVVREFFNDYWSSVDDKPRSFAERLDRAEDYINERVAAGGEAWRLGPTTRKQLGLPPAKRVTGSRS